jgi:sulfoxide reductase heme-binding subunit YedZ
MLGLLLLIPLAATSTVKAQRRLGRRWTRLHRLVYVIAILGVWHFWWQVKKDIREPLLYACGLTLLLGYRLWKHRQSLTRVNVAPLARTGGA